jgi:peroxiredoxin
MRALLLLALSCALACGGATTRAPASRTPDPAAQPALYGAVSPEMGPPQPGDAAPDFVLPGADGSEFALSAQRGHWVFLHFTASWCPFCDAEVEHLGEVAQAYAGRDVRVVLVDIEEEEAHWNEYRDAHVPKTVTSLHDASGEMSRRFTPPRAQPSFEDRAQVMLAGTVIVDPQGVIRLFVLTESKHFDPAFKAERAELDRMLAE